MFSFLKKKLSPTAESAAVPAKKARITLLIIDPQLDFHPPNGTLAVPGAEEDSARTARFIREHMDEIDEIYVTLDSHHVGEYNSSLLIYFY